MKIAFGILVVTLMLPATLHAHAEIFFPRVFSPAELSTSGFVFVNPDPVEATVYFYLIGIDGKVTATNMLRIATGGQLAKLGSELFPQAQTSGWVYVINDTEGMQAFWLNYDAGLTYLDGAEAAQYDTLGPDQIIPLVTGTTELNIINPGAAVVPLTIQLFGNDAELAPAFTTSLAIAGAFQSQASTMFPAADMSQARYVRIRTSGAAIASSAVIRSFLVAKESAVINGINVSTSTLELRFPHAISGMVDAANYTTVIGVTNLSNVSQTVTLTFNPTTGIPIVATRTIAGTGALRESAQSLFTLSDAFQGGWIQVAGTAGVAGFVAYADLTGGGLAVVPASAPQTNLFFSHIADGPPAWQTGLALLNATDSPANVEINAINSAGSLIGRRQIMLDPGQKLANVIHELIPTALGVNGGFVFVRTTNNVPLYGIELFYTQDLKVLSNVTAGKPRGDVHYVPPAPQ